MDPLALIGTAARIIGRAGAPATRLETVVDRLAEEGVRVSAWRRAPGGVALVAGLHSGDARVAAQRAMQGESSPTAVVSRVGGLAVGALTSRAKDAHLLESLAGVFAPALHRLADAPTKAPARLLGRSKAIEGVQDQITRVAASEATALLRGESGVGKELVARAIHDQSARARGPFVTVNCAALPRDLLESELFGHEKGAFTGAIGRHLGRFEQARGGTLFLDELGDLPLSVQVTLLRVLQEREFRRVGGTETVQVDARVIAATHVDLEQRIDEGTFRADLYYRLNVFPIRVPPLRERITDILLLADHFVGQYARAAQKSVRRISTPAIDMLLAYHWPGNVRELANCIERAVLITDDDVIHSQHLPPTLQTAEASGTSQRGTLKTIVSTVEREAIVEALKASRGNRAKAARQLGVSERIMGLRVKHYKIDADRFKRGRS